MTVSTCDEVVRNGLQGVVLPIYYCHKMVELTNDEVMRGFEISRYELLGIIVTKIDDVIGFC